MKKIVLILLIIIFGCAPKTEKKIKIEEEKEAISKKEEVKVEPVTPADFQGRMVRAEGKIKIKWLGHATYLITSVTGKVIIIDPWLKANINCPPEYKNIDNLKRIDLVLLTHGHVDHFTEDEIILLSRKYKPIIIALWELGLYLQPKVASKVLLMNKGGKVITKGLKIRMVSADHSSSVKYAGENVYTGEAVGYIIEFENGLVLYDSGDTGLFSDMKWVISRVYKPDIAILPIGDVFGLDSQEAAFAAGEFIKPKYVIPCHYNSYPILTKNPDEFLKEMKKYPKIETIILKEGEEVALPK